MPRVSPEFAPGLACPKCGRTPHWIGTWRGDTFVRTPWVDTFDHRIAADDRQVRKVVKKGAYDAETKLAYEHTSTLRCRCGWAGSVAQAHKVPEFAHPDGPPGYWIED